MAGAPLIQIGSAQSWPRAASADLSALTPTPTAPSHRSIASLLLHLLGVFIHREPLLFQSCLISLTPVSTHLFLVQIKDFLSFNNGSSL